MIGWMLDALKRALFIERRDPLAENRARAVERARDAASKPARYVLGAGGRDPLAPSPLTQRSGHLGSDCVGFTSWCLGHDRYQPRTFSTYDGWINTDSLMMDARGPQQWYEPIARPEPGDVVVFPSLRVDGHMTRMGHIGLVVAAPPDMPADVYRLQPAERRSWLARVRVIDCAAAKTRGDRAIAEGAAAPTWDKPDAMFARCKRAP